MGCVLPGRARRPPAPSERALHEAEGRLARAAEQAGIEPTPAPFGGAFYGPKLEFSLEDSSGRRWLCATIQLDLVLPERFDVSYVEPGGGRERPAMLHRAVLGSLERFLGVLLEHHQGRVPAWLAPDQVVVLPVGEAQGDASRAMASELLAHGVRAQVDARTESLARRVLEAHERATPIVIVIGAREQSGDLLALRIGNQQRVLPAAEARAEIVRAVTSPL